MLAFPRAKTVELRFRQPLRRDLYAAPRSKRMVERLPCVRFYLRLGVPRRIPPHPTQKTGKQKTREYEAESLGPSWEVRRSREAHPEA